MSRGACWKLGCVLLLLSCSACGDDDKGSADPAVTRGDRDGGGGRDAASPDDQQAEPDDDEPSSKADAGDAPTDGGGSSVPDSDAATNDAATPPAETADAGGTEQPGDAAVADDAAVAVSDCESLAACCEQLDDRRQTACERAIEAADAAACVEFAQRACPGGASDGGRPTPMTCEDVLECCAELEGRERMACEAAAAAPQGRPCDRAIETYCR
jgi:hypothetical protein